MTASTIPLGSDPAALEARLREVVPSVRILKERHLRRVIATLADAGENLQFHEDVAVWVDAEKLRRIDIVESILADAPARVLLVDDPTDRVPIDRPDPELLRDYWRILFRATVAEKITSDRLGELPPTAANEIRFVLEADHLVPYTADGPRVYAMFAAVYADLAMFAPHHIPEVFPALPDLSRVRELLERDVDLQAVFSATRPVGAADPEPPGDGEDLPELEPGRSDDQPLPASGLLRRADRQAALGNFVRAAILRTRASQQLEGNEQSKTEAEARSAIHDGLVRRLKPIFAWDYETAKAWSRAIVPILPAASQGIWPRAARALYDLQKIAVDLEREIYVVDPIEWIRTLGRRPLRRQLTRARSVILLRHLSLAEKHLHEARLDPADRNRLADLIREEQDKAEERVRAELGPVIESVLEEVGFRPGNVPEQIALDKLVGELLDRACEVGFVRFADLRDAVSRNQLKLPDLRGPREFLGGDPLLRADVRLAEELDGVYRRGEFYLRWIQRLNAAGFGTGLGRWLTRFVALPFGGAVLTVEFTRYLVHEAEKIGAFFGRVSSGEPANSGVELATRAASAATPERLEDVVVADVQHAAHFTPESAAITILLGFFFLGLLHVPPFRYAVWHVLQRLWAGIRLVLLDVPMQVWRSPPVRAVRLHPATRFLVKRFGLAILISLATVGLFAAFGGTPSLTTNWGLGVFLIVAMFVNTRFGRVLVEHASETLWDSWRVIRVNLLPGLVAWVQWAFRELAGAVERTLYSVDEWLRFREGQSGNSLFWKAVLATIWFPIAYLIRFGFTLLLEPQINPVKHFPVVTVSHKLLLPLIPSAADATGLSVESMAIIIGCIPGIFGFMVWEVVSNWKLYAANRKHGVEPAVLGHHGETMRGLLRPGFHSGTVPKTYRKIRQAIRQMDLTGVPIGTGKWEHEIEHVAHAIESLFRRELLPLLRMSRAWEGLAPRLGHVRVNVVSIEVEVELDLEGYDGRQLRLVFENVGGTILATLLERGWVGRLSDPQRDVLGVALDEMIRLGAAAWSDRGEAWPGKRTDEPWTWDARVAFWETATKR